MIIEKLLAYKKLFLAIGFVLTVLLMGYTIYSVFFRPMPVPPDTAGPGQATSTGGLPLAGTGTPSVIDNRGASALPSGRSIPGSGASPVANGGLTETVELNRVPSLAATLAGNGADVQYYDQTNGKFYRIDQSGIAVPMSDKIFHNVSEVTWADTKNSAILEYPDGANIYYNFDTQKQATLPKHWEDFDFSPDGSKVVMKSIGLDPDNRWLAITSPDGSQVTPIEPLGTKNDTVYPAWSPNNQIIAMFTESEGLDRQKVYFVGQNDENFKATVIEGRGFRPKWSPTKNTLLYSVYSSRNDMKPGLWMVSGDGDNIGAGRRFLNVETWSDKCAFDGDTVLYCAVPENLPEGAGLFPELAKGTKDDLYKIDVSTGLKQLVAVPDKNYNISNLVISSDGTYLYFTDETTKYLNKIRLK